MALIHDVTFDSQTRVLSLLDKAGNVISSCEVPSKGDPLTLTATANNSSVKLIKNGTLSNTFEVDTGNGWQSYTFGTVINLNAGQSCKWRCSAHPTAQDFLNYVQFMMGGSIEASGEVYSMLSSNLSDVTTLEGYDYAFFYLFRYCRSLIKAPRLSATTLAKHCYGYMFFGCSSLTSVPELPATTLAEYCCDAMFMKCKSLTKAPKLPATTLARFCYSSMFEDCQSLKEVRIAATTTATDALNNWLSGVSATGDFYCDPNASWESGASGCPSGWTRHNIADYPN